jgi:4-carboxymuconolactone decarboxylase
MVKAAIALAMLGLAGSAAAQERLPPVPPSAYDAEQKDAARAFEAARHGPVFGPFGMLMRNPELMTAARQMGDTLRFKSAIGNTLSELVILIVSREWAQDYEWNVHAPIAARQGIAQAKIDAIADGRRPEGLSEDEALVYDFTIELNREKRVSDPTYQRALKRWGEKGVVDLAGLSGYYTFLAMTMNTARSDAGGPVRLKRFPE